MSTPRIGVSLPYYTPDTIVTVAQAAERLGYHSLSLSERLLLPVREDWENEADLPSSYAWDSLEVLSYAAAHTSRIRLATTIVNSIFQSPIVLARRLATLDQLSRGRVDAGLGQGGGGGPKTSYLIPEEFAAAGVPVSRRGAGFVEHLAAMRACWGPDPVEFHGDHYEIPRSSVGPKPYAGKIPVLFGSLLRHTVERAARLADGVIIVAGDWEDERTKIGWYRDAGGTGTVLVIAFQPAPDEGFTEASFTEAALADIERASTAGADEVHLCGLVFAGVPAERQVELLTALSDQLELAKT
jgi:alkanesulfonate monooxygenase SsuD/methylene tetrahydromethanopterin reductase-like flavin-dependent oxidoreductase (luciferase family)